MSEQSQFQSLLLKSSILGSGDETRVIIDLQEELRKSKLAAIEVIKERDQAREEAALRLTEWKTAIATLHEEHEAKNRAMELVDQMKEKLGTLAAMNSQKQIDIEKELLSKSMMLTAQTDRTQETEKRLTQMQQELQDYQDKYKKSLECSSLINSKLDAEAAASKKMKKEIEDLSSELNNLKQKLAGKEMEIGRLLTEKNEGGELKSKVLHLEDQLNRKHRELEDRNSKIMLTEIQLKKLESSTQETISSLREDLKAALEGNTIQKVQFEAAKEKILELEKEKAALDVKCRNLGEASLKYKEEVAVQIQQLSSSRFQDPPDTMDHSVKSELSRIFPDISFNNSAASNLKSIAEYFSRHSKFVVTFDDFLPGNLVVLAHNANGQYELLSAKGEGGAHYILDPDCSQTWEVEIAKKEPFLGQICYISDSVVSKGFVNDFKVPSGQMYFLVAITKISK